MATGTADSPAVPSPSFPPAILVPARCFTASTVVVPDSTISTAATKGTTAAKEAVSTIQASTEVTFRIAAQPSTVTVYVLMKRITFGCNVHFALRRPMGIYAQVFL